MAQHVKFNPEVEVVQGFLKGRVVWYKDMLKDWWFFQMNNHVLLSIFGVHKLHPFGRGERLVVFFNSLCVSWFVTGILTDMWVGECMDNDYCGSEPLKADFGSTTDFDNAYLVWKNCMKSCTENPDPNLALVFSFALFTNLYIMLQRFFATCECVQEEYGANTNRCLKCCCESIGKLIMCFGFMIGVVLCVMGFLYLTSSMEYGSELGYFINEFAITQGMAMVYGIVLGSGLFFFLSCRQYGVIEKKKKWNENFGQFMTLPQLEEIIKHPHAHEQKHQDQQAHPQQKHHSSHHQPKHEQKQPAQRPQSSSHSVALAPTTNAAHIYSKSGPQVVNIQPQPVFIQPPMQPDIVPMQPPMQPGMVPMQPMQPGMVQMQPPMQPNMVPMQPMQPNMVQMQPMQPNMVQMQPPMQPGMVPMQPMQPNMVPMQPGMQPMQPNMVPMQPGMQPMQPNMVPMQPVPDNST